jgi:uncharacterized UPF0160 family protein
MEKNNMNITINTGYTHGGIFHADDVFSAALLKLIYPDISFKRVFKIPEGIDPDCLDQGYVVFDIGLGRFDHHQADNEYRENGTPYAAFGKLWSKFGPQLTLSQEAWNEVDAVLVQPIDYTDNTGDRNPLSVAIHHLNPTWDSSDSPDVAFNKAVQVAIPILKGTIDTANSKVSAALAIEDSSRIIEDNILVLDRYIPWQETVINGMPNVLYVIFPSNRGGYNAQVVPVRNGSTEPRKPFPKEWYGNPATELGMTFCHPAGFLLSAETEEAAVAITKIALEQ